MRAYISERFSNMRIVFCSTFCLSVATMVCAFGAMAQNVADTNAALAVESVQTPAPAVTTQATDEAANEDQPILSTDAAESANVKDNATIMLEQGAGSQGERIEAGMVSNLITIALDNVPVQDVVNMFSRISGANIIVSGNFTNLNVTATLKDVEWKSALNLLLSSVNLASIEDPSGIMMVVTMDMYKQKLQQMEDTKPLVTRIFTPKYLNAVDLAEQIRQMNVLSSRGKVMTSQSREQDKVSLKSSGNNEVFQNPSITTAVIVRDLVEYVEKVDVLVRELDRREPQVLIEARIVDVVSSAGKKTGFDWQMLDHYGVEAGLGPFQWKADDTRNTVNTRNNRSYQYDNRYNLDELNSRYDINGMQYEETTTTYEEQPPGSGNWVANTVITPTRTMTDSIRRGSEISAERTDVLSDTLVESRSAAAVLSMDKMSLFLSALESDNNAEMVSHPVIVVGNKVEAKIHIGENSWRISLKRNVVNTGAAPESNYSEDASPIELGLKMWVIPEVDHENSMVRLTVNPAMTIWLRDIKTEQGSVYPVTSTRQLTSRVNVPSTHTVVIGGLMENRKTKVERKVPLLGDIPLLGYLFKYNEDLEEKHNLIILITPTILDETEPLTGLEDLALATIARMSQTAETNAVSEAAAEAPIDDSDKKP